MKETKTAPVTECTGAAERFQQLCDANATPDVDSFLAQTADLSADQAALILRIDQRERWRRGDRVPTEDYLVRHPRIQADLESTLDLIFNEFLLREQCGEPADPEQFSARFPQQADQLRAQIQLHLAVVADFGETLPRPDDSAELGEGDANPDVPGYEILAEIARGGMGVVYRARQLGLNRVVALKFLSSGRYASTIERARFKTEAEAIARLKHPNVVQIYDVGSIRGIPYLALEYMEGGNLAQRLDGKPLPPRVGAALIEVLARTVHAAHERGIVHRDLKPANVLFTAFSSKEDEENLNAVPKISDFGLAKDLSAAGDQTSSGAIVGTPAYMAPEQADGLAKHVGPAADVYALGAILYELLTGRPPFHGGTVLETLIQVRMQEPVSPNRLRSGLPHDLVTICLRALAKEAERRYLSAAGLADDLRRYLNDIPIAARRVARWERAWRWGRRNPGIAASSAAAVVLLTISLIIGAVAALIHGERNIAVQAKEEADTARRRAEEAEHDLAIQSLLSRAAAYRYSGRAGQRFLALAEIEKAMKLKPSPKQRDELRTHAIAALTLPDLFPQDAGLTLGPNVFGIDMDEKHSVCAWTDVAGTCTVRRLSDSADFLYIPGSGVARKSYVSPDARFLVLVQQDGPAQFWRLDGAVAQTIATVYGSPGGTSGTFAGFHYKGVSFLPDGKQVALAGTDGAILLYRLADGRPVGHPLAPLNQREVTLAVHPTEPIIAVASYFAPSVQLRSLEIGELIASVAIPNVVSTAWRPDGQTLAVGLGEGGVLFVDRKAWRTTGELRTWISGVHVGFNHAGDQLALLGWGGNLELYEMDSRRRLFRANETLQVARFRADDLSLAGSLAGDILLSFRVGDGRGIRHFDRRAPAAQLHYRDSSLSPDNQLLAVGMDDGFQLWNAETGAELAFVATGGRVSQTKFQHDGSLLTLTQMGLLRWPLRTDIAYPKNLRLGPPDHLGLPFGDVLSVSADDRIIAVSKRDTFPQPNGCGGWLIDRESPSVIKRIDPGTDMGAVSVSPDGCWVATTNHSKGGMRIRNARDLALAEEIAHPVQGPSFSRDWLVGKNNHMIQIGTWETGPDIGGFGFFDPTGQTIAMISAGMLRIVNSSDGKELARLDDSSRDLATPVSFSFDGTKLTTLSNGDMPGVRIWDLRHIRRELKKLELDWDSPEFPPEARPESTVRVTSMTVDNGLLFPGFADYQVDVAAYSMSIALMPINPEAYRRRGNAYSRLRRYGEAVADFGRFLALTPMNNPNRAEVLFRRSFVLRQLKDQAGELADLLALTTLDAQTTSVAWETALACNNMAWELVKSSKESQQTADALKLARKALDFDPKSPMYRNTLGVALYRMGRYGDAVATLEKNLDGDAEFAAFDLYFLAMSYHRLGNVDKAREYFARAVQWHGLKERELSEVYRTELRAFRTEAETVLK